MKMSGEIFCKILENEEPNKKSKFIKLVDVHGDEFSFLDITKHECPFSSRIESKCFPINHVPPEIRIFDIPILIAKTNFYLFQIYNLQL